MVTQRGFTPALDLYQTKDSVVVEMPLSGIDPDKVNVNIENNILTVSGSTEKNPSFLPMTRWSRRSNSALNSWKFSSSAAVTKHAPVIRVNIERLPSPFQYAPER